MEDISTGKNQCIFEQLASLARLFVKFYAGTRKSF